MSTFDELLNQLNAMGEEQEELAKALPPPDREEGDEFIRPSAAGDDPRSGDDEEKDDDEEGEGEDGEMDERAPLAKAQPMTVDGEEYLDATEVIKSLQMHIDDQEQRFVSSLDSVVGLIRTQGTVIKSLASQVDRLAGQGRGRKAVLAITDPPVPAGQTIQPPVPSPQDIMAKALTAQTQGRLSAIDISRCEISLQSGMAVPADILTRLQ